MGDRKGGVVEYPLRTKGGGNTTGVVWSRGGYTQDIKVVETSKEREKPRERPSEVLEILYRFAVVSRGTVAEPVMPSSGCHLPRGYPASRAPDTVAVGSQKMVVLYSSTG